MTSLTRSWLPGGQPWITARLRCDLCRRWGPGVQGTDDPAAVPILRARLRLQARTQRRWASTTILESDPDTGRLHPHRVDLCPGCRQPATVRPQ